MTNTTNYQVGDIISYRTFTGGTRRVQVDLKDFNIQIGRSGFEGTVLGGIEDGFEVWGYDEDIVEVLERAAP